MEKAEVCKNCEYFNNIYEVYACEMKTRLSRKYSIPVNAFPDGHFAYFLKKDNSEFGIERK